MKALVVDDNPVNLEVLARLLSKISVYCDSVLSASEALELYKNNHYDVVFLDYLMPEMTGMELYDLMEKRDGTIFVMVTASGMEFPTLDRTIKKPISIDNLKYVIGMHRHVIGAES